MDSFKYDTGVLKGDAYVRRWGLDAGVKAALKHASSWDRETGAGFVDAVLRIVQAVLT
jgi:hypothetical protein